ncbi:hypothetical protein GT347_17590 [Xylophilus rhododendri]|uniref:Uncharacterized protein n=1 Tax=Xylophilus rhododendri TaxID=2697032 RepID=A0A857J9A2_9BURK|nr:hypothetical protein [Xylophilus rhododendri]QHI99629.1 hypothetical protein GT347_17590 [Xylophilus rhododendri]
MSLLPSSLPYLPHHSMTAYPSRFGAALISTNSVIDADDRRHEKTLAVDPHAPGYQRFFSLLDQHPQLGALLLNRADWAHPSRDERQAEAEPGIRGHHPRLTGRWQVHAPGWQVLHDGGTLSQALARYLAALSSLQYTEAAELLGQVTDYARQELPDDSSRYIFQRFDTARKFVLDLEDAATVRRDKPGIEAARKEVLASASATIRHGNTPRDARLLLNEALERRAPTQTAPPRDTTTTLTPLQTQRLAAIKDFYDELMNPQGVLGLIITKTGFYYDGTLFFIPLDTALQVFPEGRWSGFWFFSTYSSPTGSKIYVQLPGQQTDHEIQMNGGQYRVLERFGWRPNPFHTDDPVIRQAQLSALDTALANRRNVLVVRP